MEIGTTFKIKGNVYTGKTFTVVSVDESADEKEYGFKCEDQNKDIYFFSQVNFDYYGKSVVIISRPKFNKALLKTAINQTLAYFIQFADGDKTSNLKAVLKAADVVEQNQTIEFNGEKLEFVSSDSGQKRIVTVSGCVSTHCLCKNQMSYHKALFAILTRYNQLVFESSNVLTFKKTCKGFNNTCKGEVYDLGYCDDCLHFLDDLRSERMAA